jgi:hypothetical protein
MTNLEQVKTDTEQDKTPLGFIKRAVALRLKFGLIGTKRAVDLDDVGTGDTAKELLKLTKEVLDSAEVAAIRNHDQETRAAIRGRALPSFLGIGWYLVPVVSVDTVDAYIEARQQTRTDLVERLVDALPALKERSQQRLGHLWVEEQFPSAGVVRDKCSVASKYVTFDTPSSLKGISKALLAREIAKAQAEAGSARDAAIALLRAEMGEVVEALANAFVPGPSGRKGTIRPDTLGRVTAALDLFNSRNIAQDDELARFVEQARGLVAGKDAKSFRADESLGPVFASIKDNIAKLVTEGPSRRIDFEE